MTRQTETTSKDVVCSMGHKMEYRSGSRPGLGGYFICVPCSEAAKGPTAEMVGVVVEQGSIIDGEEIEQGKLYIILNDTPPNRKLQTKLLENKTRYEMWERGK